jgi:hypothetical protein
VSNVHQVTLDPEYAISGRTPLSLNANGISVEGTGVDWGESSAVPFSSISRYGEPVEETRYPNRVVTIPLALGTEAAGMEAQEEEARAKLQAKVALLQRQGGVLERKRETGPPVYADIINASLVIPDQYGGEGGSIEPKAVLTLTCLPDFYGTEQTLEAIQATGQIAAVLKKNGVPAVIEGDYPARTQILLTDKSGHNQRGVLYGLRSTYYSSAETAKLYYDAYEMVTLNGATGVTKTGTYSGHWVELPSAYAISKAWHPFIETALVENVTGVKHFTHIGSYRVFARAQVESYGTQLRLAWSNNHGTAPTYNESVKLPAESALYIVDLGEIRIEEPPLGEHWWSGTIQAYNGSASPGGVAIDRVWIQPVDDGAGRLRATAEPQHTTSVVEIQTPTTAGGAAAVGNGTQISGGTPTWSNPTGIFTGNSPRAHITLTSSETSKALAATSLGFNGLSGTTIRSIVGSVEYRTGSSNIEIVGGPFKSGSGITAASAHIVSGNGEARFEFPAEPLWETTWTGANIEASGFGFAIQALNAASTEEIELTNLKVTVTFTYSTGSLPTDSVIYASRSAAVRWDGAYREDTSDGAYARVSQELGELPRLPPSGLEKREVQLFVKNSRGLLPAPTPPSQETDPGIDAIEAVVSYRPCWIGRI